MNKRLSKDDFVIIRKSIAFYIECCGRSKKSAKRKVIKLAKQGKVSALPYRKTI